MALLILVAIALLYVAGGLRPGYIFLPLDLLNDDGPWKARLTERAPVSNRLLTDPIVQFHPWDTAARDQLRRGEFPWRNPYAGGTGEPLFANPSAALLSPFTWPRLLFGDSGWVVCVFLRLLTGGLGAVAFASILKASRRAAVLSGVVYALSGYSIVWGLHPHTNVFAILPWLGAAASAWLDRPRRAAALGVVAAAALATAGGHPETLAFGVVGLSAFLGMQARASARGARAGAMAAFAAAGFLLLAVQLMPFALLLGDSAFVDKRVESGNSRPRLFAMVGQVLPGALGSPLEDEIDVSPAFPGAENFNLQNEGYVGFIVLTGLVAAGRRLPAIFRRGLAVGVVGLAIAWRLPPFGWIWPEVPLLRLFAPEYASVVFVLFASLAAGVAVEMVVDSEGRTRRRLSLALILVGLPLLVLSAVPFVPVGARVFEKRAEEGVHRLRDRGYLGHDEAVYRSRMDDYLRRARRVAVRRYGLAGLCLVIAGAALARRRPGFVMVSATVVAELALFGFGYLPAVSRADLPASASAIVDLDGLTARRDVLIAGGVAAFSPDLPTLFALRDLRADSLLESREWYRRMSLCGYDRSAKAFPDVLTAAESDCLVREGVGFYLSRAGQASAPRVGGDPSPGVGVYRLSADAHAPALSSGPPKGFAMGLLVSLGAVLIAAGLCIRVRGA